MQQIYFAIYLTAQTAEHASTEVLSARDDLGMALLDKGRYREAAMECRASLVGRAEILGGSHADTLSSYHYLAEVMNSDGGFEEALQLIHQAIKGKESRVLWARII